VHRKYYFLKQSLLTDNCREFDWQKERNEGKATLQQTKPGRHCSTSVESVPSTTFELILRTLPAPWIANNEMSM